MKICLCDGMRKMYNNKYQGELMTKISLDIIKILDDIYSRDDIISIQFHLKGTNAIKALYIIVKIKFIESDDVIEVAKSRFSKYDRSGNQPGLDYMAFHKNSLNPYYGPSEEQSEILFWYTFTPEETESWNFQGDRNCNFSGFEF